MSTKCVKTQVGIIGAGPAGLVLGRILSLAGIENVILERRDRPYCEARVRAGVLEQGTVDLLTDLGVDGRLREEGLVHGGIELRFGLDGEREAHRIAMDELTSGRTVTIYGQTKVVQDLIAARVQSADPLYFEAAVESVDDFLNGSTPRIVAHHQGQRLEVECQFVAACDGFRGVGRAVVPARRMRTFERTYPFSWLGVLVDVPPSCEELIYAHHDRGFALHSMRSREVSRLYLQVDPTDEIDEWSDDRIWEELSIRLAVDGWSLATGPIIEKAITPMRSFVAEPIRHGRLLMAGDAAHIVPPTGAKGLNLAAHDVRLLGEAMIASLTQGEEALLDAYSAASLQRVWRAEDFSYWMTSLLHRDPDDADGFNTNLQRSRLRYVSRSEAAARSLAENYVGMETV